MSSKQHIEVKDLNVWYGMNKVLNHVSISIPDKKVTAIIGPSGCGKSTLLKSLNRLIELQEGVKVTGEVLVDGENILDPTVEVTHLRKKLGLLLQKPQVLPMSIYDNVAFGPRIHGQKDKEKLDGMVEKYLRQANLWNEVKNRLTASAARLSIGQQQRLCLARTLAIEPEVILGDESTSALDPVSAQLIEERFMELKKDYTIVLVTHNLRQAKRLADYVIFMYLGDLIEHGPAEEFFNKPKYAKTKAYIEGKYIEDFRINSEINLKDVKNIDHAKKVKTILEDLAVNEILKITVSHETALNNVVKEVELEGHTILELKRTGKDFWDIIVQKQNANYTI